jgi:cytochrome b involved in lipid metabolism
MARSYALATMMFWLCVAGLALWSALAPTEFADAAGQKITPEELSRHAGSDDCWMAIRGKVYDVTSYLPDHPSRPGLVEPWCGKEATAAYDTKTKGRKHSAEADALLNNFYKGEFQATK